MICSKSTYVVTDSNRRRGESGNSFNFFGYRPTMEKFINVSNRLPVTITDTIQKSSGGLVSALEALRGNRDFTWVGWPGEIANPARQEAFEEKLRSEYQYVPVFLPPEPRHRGGSITASPIRVSGRSCTRSPIT